MWSCVLGDEGATVSATEECLLRRRFVEWQSNQITKLSSGVIEEEEGVVWLFGEAGVSQEGGKAIG